MRHLLAGAALILSACVHTSPQTTSTRQQAAAQPGPEQNPAPEQKPPPEKTNSAGTNDASTPRQ